MLKHEGILFQVCRYPDVKCTIIERVQHTVNDRLYKYFTYTKAGRYIYVLPKFVKAYIDTVSSTTGMTPSKVTDSDVLAIWKKINKYRRYRVHTIRAKFRPDRMFALVRRRCNSKKALN